MPAGTTSQGPADKKVEGAARVVRSCSSATSAAAPSSAAFIKELDVWYPSALLIMATSLRVNSLSPCELALKSGFGNPY